MSAIPAVLLDLRLAAKSLLRSPGFTLVAIVTLGLGIGANTSMFSILSGYMLRPAPYAGSDRLDRIYRSTPGEPRGPVSTADYLDLKSEMGGYGEIAAYGNSEMSLSEPGQPAEMVPALRVSANLFSTLGTQPRLGRAFRADETVPGNHRVLIISHRYWQTRFGGDAHIVGRTVRVDGEPHEIVGVLPETFSDWRHLSFVDVYRPLALDAKESRDRSTRWLRLVGRRSGALPQAQADSFIAKFGRRLAGQYPVANAGSSWRAIPIEDTFLQANGPVMITMLVCLSGFVLLIACSNLANLLLARTMARAREFAVRSALGASRLQVLRPLLVESLLLAAAGGVCAIFVATWTFDWLAVRSAGDNGVGVALTFDWHVLSWAAGACLFTALAFGVAPALFVLRLDLNSTLRSGSRGNTGDRGHQRFRDLLIVGQFTLAMVLLAGAGIMVRGLYEMNNRRYGWESAHLVTGTTLLPASAYAGDKEITGFQRLALERLEALPGVASASISYSMPFFGLAEPRKYLVAGRLAPVRGHEPGAVINGITPHYFETVGTRVLSGRAFDAGDGAASPRVFIINQAMARGLFAGESPLGRRIAQAGGDSTQWGEIVGVVADIQSVFPEPSASSYQLYQPMAQEPRRFNEIAVRTAGIAPASLVGPIRTTMASLDPDLAVRQLQPAPTTIARANYQLGVLASVLSALAALGLGLASLGIYGVISRTMAQRRGEFGIRLALGAQAGDITRLVLTSGARLALAGSAIGLLGAFGITRLIAASFPNMPTNGAAVLGGVTFLLVTIALVACYLPARHASRIAPAETLVSQ
ncbi:MAG TPA: ABC transporter permease [Longimicrobiaceae bacterium]|jgi:predicted permease|nr:ABC transporter permease [Longimicrobiaceae bacterium]